jgi:hypothetical protein
MRKLRQDYAAASNFSAMSSRLLFTHEQNQNTQTVILPAAWYG